MRRGLAAGAAIPGIIGRRLQSGSFCGCRAAPGPEPVRGGQGGHWLLRTLVPVVDPIPASPRLIAALSRSARAEPIGATSGRDALQIDALDFRVLPGSLESTGLLAMAGICR